MADGTVETPFGAERLAELPLRNAPLLRVLAQIRFPRLATLATGDDMANLFAMSMSGDYPILTEQREVAVTITPDGVTQAPGAARVWQLRSADEQWQISFGDSFLAVDTAAYTSREDFAARVAHAWQRFEQVVRPPFVERLGVRYINRITDLETLAALPSLVRPEALGGVQALVGCDVRLSHSIHEALYHLDDHNGLQARWGMLPPGAVLDPTIQPVPDNSWVLDLDAFRSGRHDVAAGDVDQHLRQLAERAYRYFRWVVTPDFLTWFGGEPR
ncbi:TIGR04255 family protein [Actinoplanes sp. NPDC051494]|uniref:TIGR04255 family protein n=1 Tax=Actinoplanes sp. NPDC051494 TaxID=3363907 RepID=UPI0037AB3500